MILFDSSKYCPNYYLQTILFSINFYLQDIMLKLTFEEFRAQFSSIEAWKAKGWQPLPTIDGRNCQSWLQICEKLKNGGEERFVSAAGDWLRHGVEVKNQELFSVKDAFVDQLRKCTTLNAVSKIWNVKGNGKQQIGDIRVLQHEDAEFEKTRAWSFHIDHLSTFELPSSLQFSAVAGIFNTSSWFTEAHIEACADDSIAAVLMGTKVFIYSSEIAVSQWLLRRLTTVRSFMEMAMSGPPLGWYDKFFVCIPDHKSLVVQPTMWAHSVVTLDGPAFCFCCWMGGRMSAESRSSDKSTVDVCERPRNRRAASNKIIFAQ